MVTRAGFMGLILMASLAVAKQEVIDVGKFEIQGSVRGPEIQLIDSDRLTDEAVANLAEAQLKRMEEELLTSELPPSQRRPKP